MVKKQIRWIEKRVITDAYAVCVEIVAELSPEGWDIFERDSMSEHLYPIAPKIKKELVIKAINKLNQQRPCSVAATSQ